MDLQRLVEWPPKLKPVPVKPLFFDTAWNYIEYPGRASEVDDSISGNDGEKMEGIEEDKPTTRGWFGFGRK